MKVSSSAIGPRAIALVLIGLFLVAILPLPSGNAQTISLYGAREPYDYGWTFPEGELPGAEVTDATGDAALRLGGDTSVPALPALQSIDLRSVGVHEVDPEILLFRVGLGDLDPTLNRAESLLFGFELDLLFSLGGHDWRMTGYAYPGCTTDDAACDELTTPKVHYRGTLQQVTGGSTKTIGLVPSRVLTESDTLELLVPRWALDRAGGGHHPLAGDRITGLVAETTSIRLFSINGESTTAYHDRLPDSGSADDVYTLVQDSFGARVGIATTAPDAKKPVIEDEDEYYRGYVAAEPLRPRHHLVDAVPGETTSIPLWIENAMERKALVKTTFEVVSDQPGITIDGPEHITVPTLSHRRLQLGVTGDGTWSPEDPLTIRVHVETAGTTRPDIDVIDIRLRHLPVLSALSPRLYLHTYGDSGDTLSDAGLPFMGERWGVLNTLETDNADTGRGSALNECCFIDRIWDWNSAKGLSRDTYLDPEGDGTFHVAYTSEVPGELEVEVYLEHAGALVAYGSGGGPVERGEGSVDIPLSIDEGATSLAPDEEGFRLFFEPTFYPGERVPLGQFAATTEPVPPRLQTEGATWLELPVLPEAPKIVDARHLIVDLEGDRDPVRYVNPGKSALWTVSILNQGSEADTVTVQAAPDTGWESGVTPGARFTLGPGEAITVGVRVTAPEDTTEGAVAKVNVTAASARLEGATSGIQVSAVVTRGVPVEEPFYEADNETVERLDLKGKEKDAPSPSLFLLLSALFAVSAVARRRRGA
ncbi:MAG: hypothetical protein KY455_01170 [Euryarchaeota archaeon]|nr:hypothetical protein [Euryarchaeota archaeon]